MSDELCRILGVNHETFVPTREAVFALLHPDDVERYATLADAAAARGDRYEIDIRAVRPDGEIRYLHLEVEVELSDSGEPVASFGVIKDVTETRAVEAQRRGAEFGAAISPSMTAIYRTD